MGQKCHPLGFRIGVTEHWRSRWYATKADFSSFLVEDQKLRSYIKKTCSFAAIPQVEIERAGGTITVTIHTARPGRLIGKKGAEVDQLRESLEKLTSRKVRLKIQEIHRPELEAFLVAESIAEQLEKRAAFRRTLKKAVESSVTAGAKGIKIRIAGRLGGADMARTEVQKFGRVPLQTLRAQVDYGTALARTTYGVIGVQVWIFRGELEPGERTLGLKPIRQIMPPAGRFGGGGRQGGRPRRPRGEGGGGRGRPGGPPSSGARPAATPAESPAPPPAAPDTSPDAPAPPAPAE
ncbi:MAG: 30S ribosomal protein S3 [Planctomycetes bacterium]|jgi:small subunit ribosomal protein S3|nr:30S ribosomal protein S3 [Planctomycetota bacterium]